MDEYHVKIGDDKIKLFNMKNSWRWSQIISIEKRRAVEYIDDIDTGLIIRYYKPRKEKCFDIVKNKSMGILERAVYVVDEQLLEEIFKACYELEHVSY